MAQPGRQLIETHPSAHPAQAGIFRNTSTRIFAGRVCAGATERCPPCPANLSESLIADTDLHGLKPILLPFRRASKPAGHLRSQ